MSEEDVNVNKDLLAKLREEEREVAENDYRRENARRELSNGHAEGRTISNNKSEGSRDGTSQGNALGQGRTGTGTKNAREFDGASEAIQPGIRQTDRPSIHTVKNTGYDDRRVEKVKFQLKNPFNFKDTTKKPVKLFTKVESDLEHDRLKEVYYRGSSLLDDLLEIIVKDHEPVTIWQLDESEAEMLAELHLSRAQVNEDSARSARQLLALYDRLYFYLLVGPRMVQTFKHVEEHKGVSFK
jgi:hypothetical protein